MKRTLGILLAVCFIFALAPAMVQAGVVTTGTVKIVPAPLTKADLKAAEESLYKKLKKETDRLSRSETTTREKTLEAVKSVNDRMDKFVDTIVKIDSKVNALTAEDSMLYRVDQNTQYAAKGIGDISSKAGILLFGMLLCVLIGTFCIVLLVLLNGKVIKGNVGILETVSTIPGARSPEDGHIVTADETATMAAEEASAATTTAGSGGEEDTTT